MASPLSLLKILLNNPKLQPSHNFLPRPPHLKSNQPKQSIPITKTVRTSFKTSKMLSTDPIWKNLPSSRTPKVPQQLGQPTQKRSNKPKTSSSKRTLNKTTNLNKLKLMNSLTSRTTQS